MMIRPVFDVTPDTPQYYANHVEVSFTVHEFSLVFGRMSARVNREDIERLKENPVVRVPADAQVLVPTTLIAGLLRALIHAKGEYERLNGVELVENQMGTPNE